MEKRISVEIHGSPLIYIDMCMAAAGSAQWLYEFASELQGRPTWLIERSSAIVGQSILEGPRERVMGVVRGRRVPVPGGAAFPSWREMWFEAPKLRFGGHGEQQQVA